MVSLKTFAKKGINELQSTGALYKLNLLNEIANANNRPKLMQNQLQKAEMANRISKETDFLDIVGIESLRQDLPNDLLIILGKAQNQISSTAKLSEKEGDKDGDKEGKNLPKKAEASKVKASLTLWEIRALIAKGDYVNSLKKINHYGDLHGDDVISHHLRGVVYHLMGDSPANQVTTITEFGTAFKTKRNWESLFALGMSLIRAGKLDQVPAVIKDLNMYIVTPGQRYWADLLKGEWYLEKGKLQNAQKVAQDWIYKDPNAMLPRLLMLKVASKKGGDVKEQQAQIEEMLRKKKWTGSFEALASPLGPMALGRRPID